MLATPSLSRDTSVSVSVASLWGGRIVIAVVTIFALIDSVTKLLLAKFSVDATVQLGYQPHHVQLIGALGLICLIVYLIPRTAPIGAVLWTGYLGGEVASNVRLDEPLLSHTLFPVYFAALVWLGVYLRDARVRALITPQSQSDR
jgi:hypothetical protein